MAGLGVVNASHASLAHYFPVLSIPAGRHDRLFYMGVAQGGCKSPLSVGHCAYARLGMPKQPLMKKCESSSS